MIVKRREVPEAVAWLTAALTLIATATLAGRAIVRKVHAHNTAAKQQCRDWGIEAEETTA